MTTLDNGEDLSRYGEPEYIAYDEPANAEEIVYPNRWSRSAAGNSLATGMPHTVEEEEPGLFFKEPVPKLTPSDWNPQTLGLVAGGQPVRLIARNFRRTRLVIFTDVANTAPVNLYSDPGSSATGVGSGSIALGPNSSALIMQHTAEVYAACTANALVYFFEEANAGAPIQ